MATVNSEIILCKGIKVDKSYKNVLNYSEEKMLSLCNSNKVASANNYSFIRANRNRINVDFSYGTCLKANYMAFQNPDYSNKWFFAWIDDVNYISDGTTEITYTIDAWSTWWEYWNAKTCYVLREHVNDDGIGKNTIPEPIIPQNFESIKTVYDTSFDNTYGYYIAVSTNYDPTSEKQFPGSSLYNGQIFAEKIYLFDGTKFDGIAGAVTSLGQFLIDSSGHLGDIKNVFVVPNACINVADLEQKQGNGYKFYELKYSTTPAQFETTIELSNLNVKNNKCKCYPYHYVMATNHNGATNIYKIEQFSNKNTIKFLTQIAIALGCSGNSVPKNYKGITINVDEAIPLPKYPICEWSSDAFTNWLVSQSVNIVTSSTLSIANAVLSAKSSGKVSNSGTFTFDESTANNVTSVAGEIGAKVGSVYEAYLAPNIRGGTNTADINFLMNWSNIYFHEMCATSEYLQIADDYFTRFGYQVNVVKKPNLFGRKYWNYVEIGPGEEIGNGEVPSVYMDIINKACQSGVTIWHDHKNIGNYDLNNSIV